ncbi:hypothetical protein DHEL01_v207257 [Diaporthe helianthi]|uniref:Uncharacterized protein n=1 Tax=Diaporthe helianthi TaxID=158607 RepID=A0A2P5HVR1_DIAHE|nr:hypothetical protein DHEL01_v207257 [Diaporthe helianthi]
MLPQHYLLFAAHPTRPFQFFYTSKANFTYKDSTDNQGEADANKTWSVAPTADATATAVDRAVEPIITLEPVVKLRVHHTNASQEDLDEEAVILMQTIRQCMSNYNTLMGYLASQPDWGLWPLRVRGGHAGCHHELPPQRSRRK